MNPKYISYQANLSDSAAMGCAVFDLKSERQCFPSGWILLDGRLTQITSYVSAEIYFNTGQGFSASASVSVVITRTGRIHELVLFPLGVIGLRLKLINAGLNLELQLFTLEKIGLVERLWRMYRRTLPMIFSYSRSRRHLVGLTSWLLICDLPGAYSIAARLRLSPPDWTYTNWQYARWIRKFDTLSHQDVEAIKLHIEQLPSPPLISVLMPVYNPPVNLLREAIDSVLGQLYPHFELCIADDASTSPAVNLTLDEYARRDRRIKVCFRECNGHISVASNSALAMATGSFVALLDHDDLLAQHALYRVAVEILRYPNAEIVYSDEDKIDENGQRIAPYHKPDWNPQLALSQNFVSHLGVYRTDTIRLIGGFRVGYEGSQDYDLMLRVAARAKPKQIRHIPSILYHWRIREGSTSLGNSEKDYAWDAGRRAIEDHLSGQGITATVSRSVNPDFYRVHYVLPNPAPKVSVIISSSNWFQLHRCVENLFKHATYNNFEVIIAYVRSTDPATVDFLNKLRARPNFRVMLFHDHFNCSVMINKAAAMADGDVLCIINNNTEAITANWMEEMLGSLMQRDVGVVGARLLYQNNTIHHAGLILTGENNIAMHAHQFISRNEWGYAGRATIAQDFSAVSSACMMVKREVFKSLNGFDEEILAAAFSDVDLCLRARQAGWRVVYTPYAEFYYHQIMNGKIELAKSKVKMRGEVEFMKKKWGAMLMRDPSYNPNLSKTYPDFSLSKKPENERPWKI